MEKFNLPHDLKLFGFQVPVFPAGIAEAFGKLMTMLPQGNERIYYGLSDCSNYDVAYIAATAETFDGEGKKYGLEYYSIEKGQYLGETLIDWPAKTGLIRDIFAQLGQDPWVAVGKPLVEVYKNMKEMVCMVKIDQKKEMLEEFNQVTKELLQAVSSFNEDQMNVVPFEGSWSAGQVAQHVIKSNEGFKRIIKGPIKETDRSPDELVSTIKRDFLDFNTKMYSPDFVVPPKRKYQKDVLLSNIADIKASIDEAVRTLDMEKTCTGFELPVYGFLTRIEAIYFVIYHTKRHVHQLKNISDMVMKKNSENNF